MIIESERVGDEVTFHLPSEFNYKQRQYLRMTFEQYPPGLAFVFDFSEVQYIDSSTLGMLLAIRDQCGGEKARITFINLAPHIRHLMEVAHFGSFFQF